MSATLADRIAQVIVAGGAATLATVLALGAARQPALPFEIRPAASGPASAAGDPVYMSITETWSGQAACLNPSDASLGARLAPYLAGGGVDAWVAGFDLKGQSPAAVEAFEILTGPLSRRIAEGKASEPVSKCRDVSCAANQLFGPDIGPRVLLLAVAYRYDAADLGGRADRPWNARELDDILAAFADLPVNWLPADARRFRVLSVRDAEARARFGPAVEGEGQLVAVAGAGYPGVLLAAGWKKLYPRERRVAMVHELAHEYARAHRGQPLMRDWMRAMKEDRALARRTRGLSSVSAYADSGPGEDFAESVAAYRYMAPLLKRRAPHRYAFLREQVFGGLSYGAARDCLPASTFTVASREAS